MDYTDLKEAQRRLSKMLPERTYAHSLRTVEMAVTLAERLGADRSIVETAALLHDCAKEEAKHFLQAKNISLELSEKLTDFLDYPSVLHAPLGAYIAEHEYGVTDQRILDAITYHTTGRPGMTTEEKIVFLADGIEKGREFDGVEQLRDLAKKDLDKAVLACLESTLQYLNTRHSAVHPLTIATINYLKEKMK